MREEGRLVAVLRNYACRAARHSTIFFHGGRVIECIRRAANRVANVNDLRNDINGALANAINESGMLRRARAFLGIEGGKVLSGLHAFNANLLELNRRAARAKGLTSLSYEAANSKVRRRMRYVRALINFLRYLRRRL